MAPYRPVQHNLSLWMPQYPKLIWKDIIYTPFSDGVFTVAAKLRVLARLATRESTMQ